MANNAAIKPGSVVTLADGSRHVVIGLAADLYDYSRTSHPHPYPGVYGSTLVRRGGFHTQDLATGALGTYARKDLALAGHFTDGAEGLLPRAKARFTR